MAGYTGYLASVDYATTRSQGGLVDAKDPNRAPVQLIQHADVKRMLLVQKLYVEGALALLLFCARFIDEQHTGSESDREDLLEILTPIAKSWRSQGASRPTTSPSGFTADTGTQRNSTQYYRHNRLNAIHEGIHGIHGLDFLGRKVTMDDGAALAQRYAVAFGDLETLSAIAALKT